MTDRSAAEKQRNWTILLYTSCLISIVQVIYGLVRYLTETERLKVIESLGGSTEFLKFVMAEYISSSLSGVFFIIIFILMIRHLRKPMGSVL